MKINIKKKLKSAGSTIKGMGSIDKKSLKNGSYSMGYPGGCKYPEAVYDL